MNTSEDDVLAMAAADSEDESSLAESSLGQLSNLTKLLIAARSEAAAVEKYLSDKKAVVTNLEQRSIPDMMRELGVRQFKMDDGSVLELKSDVSASIPVDRREEAYDWAESNGHEGVVKTIVSVPFGKGENEDAKKLVAAMAKITNRQVDVSRSIHAMTLKSFVKEVRGEAAELRANNQPVPDKFNLPENMFSVFEYYKVNLKPAKNK